MSFIGLCQGCTSTSSELFFGGVIGFLIAIFILTLITTHIYFSLAWMTIAKQLRYKRPWLAWIPFANCAMVLQLGGFHWAWIFLILIPFFGWIVLLVILIISNWRVFKKKGYPGWFSFSLFISFFYMIVIGIVAWSNNFVQGHKKIKNKK